jgi:hypothetical protein
MLKERHGSTAFNLRLFRPAKPSFRGVQLHSRFKCTRAFEGYRVPLWIIHCPRATWTRRPSGSILLRANPNEHETMNNFERPIIEELPQSDKHQLQTVADWQDQTKLEGADNSIAGQSRLVLVCNRSDKEAASIQRIGSVSACRSRGHSVTASRTSRRQPHSRDLPAPVNLAPLKRKPSGRP